MNIDKKIILIFSVIIGIAIIIVTFFFFQEKIFNKEETKKENSSIIIVKKEEPIEENFNPALLEWEEISSDSLWDPRDSHATVVFKDKIWLIGG
ncbi:MAG: hypothetical protein U9Q16_02730, partial [Patescibacteria group bacterium]|nr:hypothetical protein [Patescibacteria group bacterium]